MGELRAKFFLSWKVKDFSCFPPSVGARFIAISLSRASFEACISTSGRGPSRARAGPEQARAGPEQARAGPEQARAYATWGWTCPAWHSLRQSSGMTSLTISRNSLSGHGDEQPSTFTTRVWNP